MTLRVRNVILAVLVGFRLPPDCDRSSDLPGGRFVPQATVSTRSKRLPYSITCRRLRLTGLPQADKSLLSHAE